MNDRPAPIPGPRRMRLLALSTLALLFLGLIYRGGEIRRLQVNPAF